MYFENHALFKNKFKIRLIELYVNRILRLIIKGGEMGSPRLRKRNGQRIPERNGVMRSNKY